MRNGRLLPPVLALALVLAACGGGDEDRSEQPATGRSTTTVEGPAATDDDEGPAGSGTSAPDDPGDGCTDDLVVAGSDGVDGPVEVATAITDDGPHPANTTDADGTLSMALATYELEADPQFGLSIPVGVPGVPAGELIYVVTLALDDPEGVIAVGDTFADATGEDTGAAGRIANHGLYSGTAGRINPLGQTTIEITTLTDEQVCGTITAVGETELQSFPTLTGTFAADRLQALEAEG